MFEKWSIVLVALLKEFFPGRCHSRDEQRLLTAKDRGQGFDLVLGSRIYPRFNNLVNLHIPVVSDEVF